MKAKRKKVAPIPAGYHSVTPYLACGGCAAAIEFYKIVIGDSHVMLADEYAEMDFLGPKARGGSPVQIHLYVRDSDATAKRAVAAGAKLVRAVSDQFYGDRMGTVEDPFGHVWHIATHTVDLSKAELRKRAAAEAAKKSA